MRNKLVLFSIGFLLVVSVALIGGRLPYFMLYFYIGILGLPFLQGLLGKYKIHGHISLPTRDLVAGETIELTTEFSNPTKYTFPRVEYKSRLTELLSDQTESTKTFHLSAKESFVDKTMIQCRRRGTYTLGETQLIIKDVFNLFQFKKSLKAPIALKVYPRIVSLSDFTIEAGLQMGDFIVDDPIFQDYSSIDALRDYRDGDSVKKIHWKASAKQDQLIVKEFEFRGDAEVILMLDPTLNNYANDPYRHLEDKIVEVGVSITHYCLLNHLKISYITNEKDKFRVTTGSSDAYLKVFLEQFVDFSPCKELTLTNAISQLRPTITQGNTLLVVTPLLNKRLATELVDLKMSNIRPMVFLVTALDSNTKQYEEQVHLMKKIKNEAIPVISIKL